MPSIHLYAAQVVQVVCTAGCLHVSQILTHRCLACAGVDENEARATVPAMAQRTDEADWVRLAPLLAPKLADHQL